MILKKKRRSMREMKDAKLERERERERERENPMLEFLRGKRVFGAPFRTTQTSQQRKTESRLRGSRKREGPLHPGRFSPLLVFSSFLFETKTVSRCVNPGFSRGNG
jgi:hypothetical protein